jgi:hypothetical protein
VLTHDEPSRTRLSRQPFPTSTPNTRRRQDVIVANSALRTGLVMRDRERRVNADFWSHPRRSTTRHCVIRVGGDDPTDGHDPALRKCGRVTRRDCIRGESAEVVTSADVTRLRRCDHVRREAAVGRREFERAVLGGAVVVRGEDAEDVLELALVEDQQPVEALAPKRAGPPLRDRVRVRARRLDRRPDNLDAVAAEDAVEGVRELAVAVVD